MHSIARLTRHSETPFYNDQFSRELNQTEAKKKSVVLISVFLQIFNFDIKIMYVILDDMLKELK